MTQIITRFSDTDIAGIRSQFPILKREVKGKPLVYFDNAATSQKPQMVIDALVDYYSNYNANIHRGIHTLAEEATAAYEATRDAVQKHINAEDRSQILFTKGTTEGINLVAQTWGRANLKAGDEVIISGMEHHSNIVPWQIVCGEKGAILKVIPVTDKGELDMEAFHNLLSERTKFVSIVHVSNAMGTVNPVKDIIDAAHKTDALVLIDGAQSTVHLDIDVQALNCDFFAFSGHKLYGPTGVGVLYGKADWLNEMPVYQGGGEMIKTVSFAETIYNEIPYKYEAGTPNIADVVVLKSAFDFIEKLGKPNIRAHEDELLAYGESLLNEIDGLKIIGQAASKVSLTSFIIDGVHPQDIGILLDNKGIAVRTGHHCAQPLMDSCQIPGTIRASYAVYNTKEEIDIFVDALKKAIRVLR